MFCTIFNFQTRSSQFAGAGTRCNSFLFDSITQSTIHKNYLKPDFLHFVILFILENLGVLLTVLVCSGAILSLKPKEILTKMS